MKARQNTVLHVRATGSDAEAAADAVAGLVARDFDEPAHGQ